MDLDQRAASQLASLLCKDLDGFMGILIK
jgi:hypothetical protein